MLVSSSEVFSQYPAPLYTLYVFKLRYNKKCPFMTQSSKADFQEPSIFLRNIFCFEMNVRWSNVIKPLREKMELGKS